MSNKLTIYSDAYIERLFQWWYTNNAPAVNELNKIISETPELRDEFGRVPSLHALSSWFDERNFRSRKDLLDARVETQIDNELVALKVHMLNEQASAFRAVRKKAEKFLLETEFDSSASAVHAFIRSSQEERIARGLSKTIQRLASMDDEDLLKNVRDLAAKVSGEILDVEEIEEEDAGQ